MEESKDHEISITVTCQRLVSLAECSCRMTGYADPDGKRLITILKSQDGTPVRLVLDRCCIQTGAVRACALSPPREKLKNICIPRKEAIVCLAKNQRSKTKG